MNIKIIFLLLLILIPYISAYSYPSSEDYEQQAKQYEEEMQRQIKETQERISQDIQKSIEKQIQETQENVSEAVAQNIESTTKGYKSQGNYIIAIILILILLFVITKIYSYYKTKRSEKDFVTPKGELAAIMFTDMKGFSKHVGKNEQETLKAVWEYEKIMRPIISKNSGRVIKTIGDSIMATFKSAVDSINCAMQIQDALKGRKFKIRIGLHLGEITSKEKDVYGNNVNIASRIEGKAPVGGVAVSEDIYKQANGRVKYKFRRIGTEKLKNIKEPVRLYKVI